MYLWQWDFYITRKAKSSVEEKVYICEQYLNRFISIKNLNQLFFNKNHPTEYIKECKQEVIEIY